MILFIVAFGSAVIGATLFRNWLRKKCERSPIQIKITPAARVRSFAVWTSLRLLMVNRSDSTVWIEGVRLVMKGLEARHQTIPATGQDLHAIRRAVAPNESMCTLLTGILYEAAGRPQGPYSFLVSGTVDYRIGEHWSQMGIHPYRIEMTSLCVLRLRRIRQKDLLAETQKSQKIMSASLFELNPSNELRKAKAAGR